MGERTWEHDGFSYRTDEELWVGIRDLEKDGWQLTALGTAAADLWGSTVNRWAVFKRLALDAYESEQER